MTPHEITELWSKAVVSAAENIEPEVQVFARMIARDCAEKCRQAARTWQAADKAQRHTPHLYRAGAAKDLADIIERDFQLNTPLPKLTFDTEHQERESGSR